jgi:predicted transcriptional regulator
MEAAMTVETVCAVSIQIDENIRTRLERLAEVRHLSPQGLMHDAITQYVDREERREAFRQDTLTAWEDHCRTGRHLTAAEADAWLAQLEAGHDVDPPACRI